MFTLRSKSGLVINTARADEKGKNTVTIDGVGKTEDSAKKSALKKALVKYANDTFALGEPSKVEDLVRNQSIERIEKLFVKNTVISSTKNEDGLVDLRLQVFVNAEASEKFLNNHGIKTKSKKPGEDYSKLGQTELRKNAAQIVSTAIEERKACFKVFGPTNMKEIKNNYDGSASFIASFTSDTNETKNWVKKWSPIFSRMALIKTVAQSQYQFNGECLSDESNNTIRRNAHNKDPNKSQIIFITMAESFSSDGLVKWGGYKIPCNLADIKVIPVSIDDRNQPIIDEIPSLKVVIDFQDKDGNIVHQKEIEEIGLDHEKGTIKLLNFFHEGELIEFPPYASYHSSRETGYATKPKDCAAKIDLVLEPEVKEKIFKLA